MNYKFILVFILYLLVGFKSVDYRYNNPLDTKKEIAIEFKSFNNLPTIKIQKSNLLGTNFPFYYWIRNINYDDIFSSSQDFIGSIPSGLRFTYGERFDPIDKIAHMRIQREWNEFNLKWSKLYNNINKKGILNKEKFIKKYEDKQFWGATFVPINKYIKMVSKDNNLSKRLIIGLNVSFAYDNNESYIHNSILRKGRSHHVFDNPKKYIPMIAKRNGLVIQRIKNEFGNSIFKNLYFELGNESTAENYGGLTPKIYAQLVKESLNEMKKVIPDIKTSFFLHGNNKGEIINFCRKCSESYKNNQVKKNYSRCFKKDINKNNYLKNYICLHPDLKKDYSIEDIIKELKNQGLKYSDFSGVSHHLYNYDHWKQQYWNHRKALNNQGFGKLKSWISEINTLGSGNIDLNNDQQNDFSYSKELIYKFFEISNLKNIGFIDLFSTPGNGFGQSNIDGLWSQVKCISWNNCYNYFDPFLKNKYSTWGKKDLNGKYIKAKRKVYWKPSLLGSLYKKINLFIFESNDSYFETKILNSNKNFFEIIGINKNKKIKGIFINKTNKLQKYYFKKINPKTIIEISKPEITSNLISKRKVIINKINKIVDQLKSIEINLEGNNSTNLYIKKNIKKLINSPPNSSSFYWSFIDTYSLLTKYLKSDKQYSSIMKKYSKLVLDDKEELKYIEVLKKGVKPKIKKIIVNSNFINIEKNKIYLFSN